MYVSAENLVVRYPNGALGIEDVSLEIGAGQVIALIGANGAGKTTTCRAISGFLRAEGARVISGKVTVDGRDVTGWEPHRLVKAGISAVPERNKIFPNLTVREHFTSVGMHRSRAERDEGLELGLSLFPVIQTRMKQAAGMLSGGQQQMVALIRAMVGRPQLLVVDEMTLGLHVSLQAPLFEAMTAISKLGTACLVIDESATHTLSTAEYCYLIEGGHIARHGPSDDFRNPDGLRDSAVAV